MPLRLATCDRLVNSRIGEREGCVDARGCLS